MKYQALEEQLDNGRKGSKADAFGAMKACVEYWADLEGINAIVGAFYELGLDPEKADIKQDGDTFDVYSKELELLSKEELNDLRSTVEELFEKRMGDLYGIYFDISFPGALVGTMRAQLDLRRKPEVVTKAFQEKASRI